MAFNLGDAPYATWAVDAQGAAVWKIAVGDPGGGGYLGDGQYGYYADISPDGSRIVYSTCEYTIFDHDVAGRKYNRGYEIASVNVDGSGRQRLTDNVHFENYPAWSPDGNRIAFIAHNDYSRLPDYDYWLEPTHYDTHNSEIFIRAADGTDERVVPNTKGVGLYPPVWSPDGERLAFTAHEGQRRRYGHFSPLERILYTVRLDGSERVRIATGATTLPTWSADGERVAYGLDDRVYSVRFDGTDRRRVLGDFRAHRVSWSPDGSEFLLASDGGVYIVRPDGSGLRRLGPRVRTTDATWSPDGSMIAARHEEEVSTRELTLAIFVMDRDGTYVRFLAEGFTAFDEGWVRTLAVEPIDSATCSNGVAVAQPEANAGLVEDCKALIRSRYGFGPRATSGWTTDTSITKWPGVDVRGDPPRVRGLGLWSNIVAGTLPPEIAKLTMRRSWTSTTKVCWSVRYRQSWAT